MVRTFSTTILIRSELQYFAIYQKSKKKLPGLQMLRTLIIVRNHNAEK